MILVDTSVWVHHLRTANKVLMRLLDMAIVLAHPLVIGELALGNLRQRDLLLTTLHDLPRAMLATNEEVLEFIGRHRLQGSGIGYVDAHLLASVCLTMNTMLWTQDNRLRLAAEQLDVAWQASK